MTDIVTQLDYLHTRDNDLIRLDQIAAITRDHIVIEKSGGVSSTSSGYKCWITLLSGRVIASTETVESLMELMDSVNRSRKVDVLKSMVTTKEADRG